MQMTGQQIQTDSDNTGGWLRRRQRSWNHPVDESKPTVILSCRSKSASESILMRIVCDLLPFLALALLLLATIPNELHGEGAFIAPYALLCSMPFAYFISRE